MKRKRRRWPRGERKLKHRSVLTETAHCGPGRRQRGGVPVPLPTGGRVSVGREALGSEPGRSTPTCGSRAASLERGLVHRRRLQPSTSRRGCCSAAAAARSPAGPKPGFPPAPHARWPVGRGSTGPPSCAQLRGERRQRRLPHVSPGCSVNQQFPPGPQRRLRRCCHRLSHIPGLHRSRRRRRRAATTTPSAPAPCSLLHCFPSARRPASAGPGPGDSAGGRREAAAAPSPQSTARLRWGGRAGAGAGAGGALAASVEDLPRGRRGCCRHPPGREITQRGSPAPPPIVLRTNP